MFVYEKEAAKIFAKDFPPEVGAQAHRACRMGHPIPSHVTRASVQRLRTLHHACRATSKRPQAPINRARALLHDMHAFRVPCMRRSLTVCTMPTTWGRLQVLPAGLGGSAQMTDPQQLWEILEAGQEHPNMAAAKKAGRCLTSGAPSVLATGGGGVDMDVDVDVDVMRPGMPMGSTTVLAPTGA